MSSYLADLFYSASIYFYAVFLWRIKIAKAYIYILLFTPVFFEFMQFFYSDFGFFDIFDVLILLLPLPLTLILFYEKNT
jgi:hypothetical protein